MDPQYLLKDEVEFELACRGYVQKGGLASALKLILKKMMVVEDSQQVSYKIKLPSYCRENPNKELEICSDKLDTILRYVSELNEKPDKQLYKRLVSRLVHIINRLKLIESGEELDKERQKALIDKAAILLNDVEIKDDLEDDDKITPEMKEELHKSLGEDSHKILEEIDRESPGPSSSKLNHGDRDGNVFTFKPNLDNKRVSFGQDNVDVQAFNDRISHNALNSTTIHDSQVIRKHKLVPISQWGVQFMGDNSYSVNAFIERVYELKDARNATDDDLWRYAIDFFKGDALIWFRANRKYIENWEELVLLLKRTFQSPLYQEELLSEAKSRTQGKHESVVIFVSVMQNFFNRLPNQISEVEKISIIVKNLLPYYQRAVCRDVFTSVSDLINVLRIVERTKINCDNFQEPNSSINSLEPDLAYRLNPMYTENNEIHEMKGQIRNINNVKLRCWNCRETGHLFRSCSVPKQRLFCYKCGRFGITSKDCSCKGNAQGKTQNPAN